MAILVIDTSVFVAMERSELDFPRPGEQHHERTVAIAAITASELLHGVHRADTAIRRSRRERFVEDILTKLPVLPFDAAVARVHSRIWADLRARGTLIGAHDLLIAATVVHHEAVLWTANARDFGRIEGLEMIVSG